MRAKHKVPRLPFFPLGRKRAKNRGYLCEKGRGTLSLLACAVHRRGVTFRLFGKKFFDRRARFSQLKNTRRDEAKRGENPQSYPKTRKPTPRGTWRAFATMRASRGWALMLVTLADYVELSNPLILNFSIFINSIFIKSILKLYVR